MNNIEVKSEVINALFNRGEWTKQVNEIEYRTRCPYCGDSLRENTGHFYIRISVSDNLPILYNCFKCGISGVLKEEQLSKLGIENPNIKNGIISMNKTADKIDGKNLNSQYKTRIFNFKTPKITFGPKTNYIEERLGFKFNKRQYEDIKIITSLKDFLELNEIKTSLLYPNIVKKLEDHYVGFLTYGNSHILFRDVSGKEEITWVKYPIIKESNQNRVLYTIASQIDIFTKNSITVNIAEGVMDVISAKYNLLFDGENHLHVAVAGKYYERVLLFLIDLGIVGSNVNINIFADNDLAFNKKAKNPTTVKYFKKALDKYRFIFGNIVIYYNQVGKDIGVRKDQISLIDYKI